MNYIAFAAGIVAIAMLLYEIAKERREMRGYEEFTYRESYVRAEDED